MKNNLKKGDLVIANGTQGEIEGGKKYKIKKVDGNFVFLNGCESGYFKSLFKKVIKFPKVKKLDDLNLINSRADVNAEKIQELIQAFNEISEILEEIY